MSPEPKKRVQTCMACGTNVERPCFDVSAKRSDHCACWSDAEADCCRCGYSGDGVHPCVPLSQEHKPLDSQENPDGK